MRLCDCFIELIAYVVYFRARESHEGYSLEQVQNEISRLIEKSVRLSEEHDFSPVDFESARFAVFVWVDETIMQSSWSEKAKWKKSLLQRQYYKTTGGGVEFYDKLNQLEPEQNDIREVYYMCMVAGFSGRYGNSNEDIIQRDDIKSKNLKRLTGTSDGVSSSANEIFFKESYCKDSLNQSDSTVKKFNASLMTILVGAGPLFIFVFLFILFRFILNNEMITKLVP